MKVFLRTLLYATSKRGRIIESMFVRLQRGETSQNFNFWVYGEGTLHRGSGLFVPDNGIATNHHFVLPPDGTSFEFLPGAYRVQVFASLVGDRNSRLLRSMQLSISPEQSAALKLSENGLFFDWGPDSAAYHAHIRTSPPADHDFAKAFRGMIGDPFSIKEHDE